MPVQPGRTSVRPPTAPPRRPLPSDSRPADPQTTDPQCGEDPPGQQPSDDDARTGR
ncbi:hypothetical protein [Modestobacter sp. NPDC049651]|uniref:hypothetical protein n=1 Tax=unclassified Modestobacter TaxID=2643866 RepID=UPI0033DD9792